MKNEETNAIRRSGLTDIELEQVSGGCNNGHEPQWKPIGCRHPGCYKIVKVDVANQSSILQMSQWSYQCHKWMSV